MFIAGKPAFLPKIFACTAEASVLASGPHEDGAAVPRQRQGPDRFRQRFGRPGRRAVPEQPLQVDIGGGAQVLTLAFARNRLVIAAAILAAALPHLIGAPHPESAEGAVPPELAARFVTASLGGAALFWAILGSACGWLMSGLVRESESRPAPRAQPGAR